MRIRGMNEETEELDDSLVNIKGDVYELTNGKVSIMEDPDTYKSTYQILQEISKVWDELTDKQQAQLLDKLFGKTRAQIGASIISNFSQAEAAIKTMSESAGAADREMDIIKNSLEYKINALKETFTGIWQNVFNREDLGAVVDFATGIAEVLDGITEKLGLFGSAIAAGGIAAGVMGIANAFKAFSAASGALTMVEALSGAFPGLSAAIGAFSTAMATTGGAAGVLHGALSGLWALIAAHPILAVAAAMGVAFVAFDHFNESVDEANDKMKNSFDAYEDAKQNVSDVYGQLSEIESKMDALEQKKGLTFIEEQQLADLREAAELVRLQADIAEKQEQKAAAQAAEDTLNAYNRSYGNWDRRVSDEAVNETASEWAWYDMIHYSGEETVFGDKYETDLVTGLADLKNFTEKKEKAYEEAKDYLKQDYDSLDEEAQYAVDEYQNYADTVDAITGLLQDQLAPLAEYKQNFEKLGVDNLTAEQKVAYKEINDAIRMIYEATDPATWKQMQFDKIFDHAAFKQAKADMIEVALASENLGVTVDDVKQTLGDDLYGKLDKELSNAGFSMDDFVNQVNSEAEILDIDRVKENIKNGIEEATEEATSDTDTVEPEVEVEPKVTVKNNAEEKAKFDEWVDGLSDDYAIALQKLMGDQTIDTSSWDTAAYQSYLEGLMTGTEDATEATSELTGTIQDLQNIFNDSTDGGLTKAISNYKEQMSSLTSARDKWNKGELSVDEMLTLQQSFVELNDYDMSNFGSGLEEAIDGVVGKFEEADTTFKDFKENIIDKDDALKEALSDISTITKDGFKDAEAGISKEYSESVNMIMDAASRAGLVNRKNKKEVDAFIDSLFESGIITGKTGEITEKATGIMGAFGKAIRSVGGENTIAGRALVTMRDNLLGIFNQTGEVTSAYSKLKDTLGTFTQYQTDVSAALKASKSATGLTAEQVQTLTSAYKDLNGFNPATLFERTANGIHLNEEEFKRLNQEVQNSTLLQMYSDLGLKLDELHAAQARGEDTSGLEKDIADAQMLIAQYEGLTSALYAWQSAQSNGNERDSFESVAKGYDSMEKILNQGWYGDESLNSYLDLMLSASERTGDAVTDFEKLGQTIEGTGHSLKDYFTFEDGNLVSDGLFDFLDDVNAKMGDSFASIDENGNYAFDFTGDKLQQVAKEFGTTTEFIQLMERAMIDAGLAVEMSSSSFETMKETLEGLQQEGKISPDIDLGNFDAATASADELQDVIDRLNEEKARIEVESDGSEEAQQTLDTLDRTINSLTAQKVRTSIEVAVDNGNSVEELLAMDDTTLAATLNVDASEVDTARAQLEELNGATETTTVTVKLDSSQFEALTDTSQTVTVTYSVDAPDAPTYEDQTPSVTYGITAPDAPVYPDQNPSVNYHINAPSAPYYPNMDRYVTYHISTVGSAPSGGGGVDGTAHVRGTAFANGNRSGDWGTKSGGIALGGELGEELLVRDGRFYTIGANSAEFFRYQPDDIIFNAEQTKEIFEKGKITHGSRRGEALVSGTAFDSGSGGRRRHSSNGSGGSSGGGSGGGGSSGGGSSGGSSGGGGSSSSDDDREKIDYIEMAIDRIQRAVEKFKKTAENIYKSFKKRNDALNKQINKINEELNTQIAGAERYKQEADSVNLDGGIKQKVREGAINITEYDDDTAEKIKEYQKWYEKMLDCQTAAEELRDRLAEIAAEDFDLVVAKYDGKVQSLEHSMERLNSLISRRSDYASEYVTPDNARSASTKNIKSYQTLVTKSQQEIAKKEEELGELREKLQASLAQGVDKNSEGYREMQQQIYDVENDIDDLYSDIIGYSNHISEEYMNMFDAIGTKFENKLAQSEHLANEYNTALETAEAKGLIATDAYYKMLRSLEKSNIKNLKKEYDQLTKAMNNALESGEIQEGSQAWYDMKQKINETSEAIKEAELNVIELNNSIRQVKWDNFDYMEEQITELTDEADFLIDLLGDAKLVDDKGSLTKEGMATMGLHGQNYNVLMLQADDYAKQIKSINKDIAKDPSNTELIKRRQELYDMHQKMILAANDEKQAIKDLVEKGIKSELSSLKDLISDYTNALDSQKDLYDFQKKLADQTKNLATLRKQLAAYENDLTEETRAKVQKIRVSIDEAEEEIEQTQYEKYIKDQKKLLNDLYDEYEKILNERLDNLDFLIEEAIATINSNATDIYKTLTNATKEVGYTMTDEMKSVWNAQSQANKENIQNRIDECLKLVNKLIEIGAISKSVGNKITTALAGGNASAIQKAVEIIQKLTENGTLSTTNAVNLMTKLSDGDAKAVQNSLRLVEQLKANGEITKAQALSLLNGIVVGTTKSETSANKVVAELLANKTLTATQGATIVAGMADGDVKAAQNASRIVAQLLSNKTISTTEAAKLLSGITTQDVNTQQKAVEIITKLTENGKISADKASQIIAGMTTGNSQEALNASKIITQLLANGQITKDEAAKILLGVVSQDQLADLYAKDATDRLTKMGLISDKQASTIKSSIEASTGEQSTLATYQKNFSSLLSSINITVSGIKATIDAMLTVAQAIAQSTTTTTKKVTTTTKKNTKTDAKTATTTKKATTTTKKATTTKKTTTTTKKKVTTTTKKGHSTKEKYGVALAIWNGNYGWGTGDTRKKRLEEKGFNYNEIQGIVNQMGKEGLIHSGAWVGHYQGITSLSGYGYNNFAKGSKRVGISQLAWTNENADQIGGETILRASDHAVLTKVGSDDRIYNAMASQNLWEMANNPSRFIASNLGSLYSRNALIGGSSSGNNVNLENVNFNLPSVKNYEEFVSAMQKDKKFESMIQQMTLGTMTGRNGKNAIHWN